MVRHVSSRLVRSGLCSIGIVLVCCLGLNASRLVLAAEPLTEQAVSQALQPLLDAHTGVVSCSVQILDEDNTVQLRWSSAGERVMPTASLIKLPVMIEAYRQAHAGQVSLDDQLTLTKEDQVPGSGILTDHFSPGVKLSLRDAIRLMIRYSDNSATNLVAQHIGLGATSKTMAEWGFAETQLHSLVYRRDTSIAPERSTQYGLGSTTANDMVELLVRLQRGEMVSPEASQEMLAHLLTCDDRHKLPRDLPTRCKVAHKTGAVSQTRTDAGLIEDGSIKFAICVLTDKNQDTSWSDDNTAHRLIGRVARTVYDLVKTSRSTPTSGEAAAEAPTSTTARELSMGATGKLVEDLQRTLNARVSAGLSVDGDFGPATQQAVRQFQSSVQLATTGVVDQQTWAKLGVLVEHDTPVPAAQEINGRTLPRSAALNPLDPPQVTAKAWAILDVASGKLLADGHGHERLPMASTTKVMTALLVLKLANREPQILDEQVTFSTRADETIGSTSAIRAGEQLPVSELLYGLLLPSGNDASVALAEHFGARLVSAETLERIQQSANTDKRSTAEMNLECFVAAMNAEAERLGLRDTHFANPHGLTATDHYSSAADLARLGLAAWQEPRLREIVSCRERVAEVQSLQGYQRRVLWQNTNQLLGQEGFHGMKTGTTEAAGACLIALGSQPLNIAAGQADESAEQATNQAVGQTTHQPEDERRLQIVVVLGSANSEARYVDARNLFAWTWRTSE